ncbi:TIGR03619 family F420-dependent LLM class oxidoreductase [Streptomyces sp. NPDC096057]|uniref:TIGR03619 family F420-dependent LLM class oxidoreductase n=1 Tax=Streptomyces sp. NPDC096057 TaxID=3155543 RepID=UPI0033235614
MRLGFSLPTLGSAASEVNGIARFAAEAKKLGATSLWVSDRLLAAVDPIVGYQPGSKAVPAEFRVAADSLTALAIAATVTSEVRLGTHVMTGPWHAPALLARTLTTIDVASGGRLTAGFGTSWSPEEYQAAGVPFEERGTRLDELLDVLEAWWTANPVAHKGTYYTIPASHVQLKPVQRPRPPIYLGGFTPRALRRVGKRADGWMPIWLVPEVFPASQVTDGWSVVRREAEEAGRDPDKLGLVLRVNVSPGTSIEAVAEGLKKVSAVVPAEETLLDFTYAATTVDQCIDLAGRALELVAAG